MRLFYYVLAILSGFLAWQSWLGFLAAVPLTGLVPERSAFDFGNVGQGQDLAANFTLRNDSAEALTIKTVSKSCTCTNLTLSSRHVDPAQSTTIGVTWKTKASRGSQSLQLYVVYAFPDGTTFQLPLHISGFVVPDVEYKGLTQLSTKSTHSRVSFTSTTLGKVEIANPRCTHRAFTAKLARDGEVLIEFQPLLWSSGDSFPVYLRVDTNSRNEPICNIPLEIQQ